MAESKKYESLAEYIFVHYEKIIKQKLMAYFKENALYGSREEWDEPEKYGFAVEEIKLSEPRVFPFWSSSTLLDFDMLVHAITTIRCMVGDEAQLDFFENDFTFCMAGKIGGGKLSIGHKNICVGKDIRPFDKAKSLNPFLVPFISTEMYEAYATEMLIQYCPEAVNKPTKINPFKFAGKMGLRVDFGQIPSTSFGKIVFAREQGKIYDFESKQLVDTSIPANTIVVALKSLEEHRYGNIANTIIHECVHKYIHQNYFELQTLLNSGETSLTCHMKEMENPSSEKLKNKFFMEIQAKSIAPKILMPASAAKKKFNELLKKLRRAGCSKYELFDAAVLKFADFFGTSVESSIIRLKELGFSKAVSSKKNSENKVEKSYKSSVNLKGGKTFIITEGQATEAILCNEILNKYVSKGLFVYVDGMFVINDKKYVKRYKSGGTRLTGLALRDVSKCCLIFDSTIENTVINFDPETFNMVTFSSGGFKTEHTRKTNISFTSGSNRELISKAKSDGLKNPATIEYNKANAIVIELRKYRSFGAKLSYLLSLEEYRNSDRQIGVACGLDGKTIASYKKGISTPDQNKLYAICGGLKLHPIVSEHLFGFFGWDTQINCEDEKRGYYNFLLRLRFLDGLESWNTSIKERFPDDVAACLP